MTAMYTGPLAEIGLTLPPASMHSAVAMVLTFVIASSLLLFWAMRHVTHDRPRS